MKQRCYFHKNEFIQNFCVQKQCTLPLCCQCLSIHEEQHNEKNQQPNIISYSDAYNQVLNKLQNFVIQNKGKKEIMHKKLKKDKQEAIKLIQNYFRQHQETLNKQYANLETIEQKFQKLIKGSIKSVIYYYSGEINLEKPLVKQFNEISSNLKHFLQNFTSQGQQQIQTFRQSKPLQRQFQNLKIDRQNQNGLKYGSTKKRQIFSHQKTNSIPTYKNTNQPYVDNNQNVQKNTYTNLYKRYQNQRNLTQQSNHNQNFKNQPTNFRNIQIGEVGDYLKQDIHRKTNVETSSYQFMDRQNNHKEQNFRKTLDKYPSLNQLKRPISYQRERINNQEEFTKEQTKNSDLRPGKWSKPFYNKQNLNYVNQTLNSFNQPIQKNHINTTKNHEIQNELFTRKPLTTDDLKTFTPAQNNPSFFQPRERTFSHQTGLRTTMSHTNLPSNKKMQPLLNENLKKQVLSPHQIRKMLEKKIQERNKVLTEKKQYTLKINTDRNNVTNQSNAHNPLNTIGNKYDISKESNQDSPKPVQQDNFRRTFVETNELKPYGYNTKDSIINQIYRQTRY